MHERKRKCSPMNPGETVLVKKCPTTENLYPLSKRPCFPTAQNLVEDVGINNGNFPSDQRINLSYAISNQNQNRTVVDTSTTGYFPYPDVHYKPRMCLMCAAGDSGHINHILS